MNPSGWDASKMGLLNRFCSFIMFTTLRTMKHLLYIQLCITFIICRHLYWSIGKLYILTISDKITLASCFLSSGSTWVVSKDCLGYSQMSRENTNCWFRGGGWGCEVSCGGHHRPRGKTTTGSALDGAVFDIAQILAYLVHNMSRSQLYLGSGHFGWLFYFFGQ